jgi:phage portal protein BeeE
MVAVFEQVVGTGDRYGLHAYLTALENADLRAKLEQELESSTAISIERKARLRGVLQTGTLNASEAPPVEKVPISLRS